MVIFWERTIIKSLLKLCVLRKIFPHQGNRWNYGNFCSGNWFSFIVCFTYEPPKTYENGNKLKIFLVWHKKRLMHNNHSVTKNKSGSFWFSKLSVRHLDIFIPCKSLVTKSSQKSMGKKLTSTQISIITNRPTENVFEFLYSPRIYDGAFRVNGQRSNQLSTIWSYHNNMPML